MAFGDNMTAQKGDHVSVDYWGTLEDGTQFDSSEGRQPLEFDVGAGQMIKGFDDGVVGMREGETKIIKIPAKDAYGDKDYSLVIDISLEDIAKNNITPKIGMIIYSQGNPGTITNVGNETTTVDFNHPFAGKRLIFKIKMIEIIKKK
ncbi:MAG: FKBP-type peptidyl-prolyl cis-trans isomerase [Candidatus Aenigmarchaeota archaeon]|nr:FKBP-type peptidyl-prolyl cis-trans isomerase [Candidatus Aenigmarchaeota archaeon]